MAQSQPGVLIIAQEQMADITVLTTNCRDYDAYSRLPDLVRYEGRVYGKTGWNSDTQIACYRNPVKWAEVEK